MNYVIILGTAHDSFNSGKRSPAEKQKSFASGRYYNKPVLKENGQQWKVNYQIKNRETKVIEKYTNVPLNRCTFTETPIYNISNYNYHAEWDWSRKFAIRLRNAINTFFEEKLPFNGLEMIEDVQVIIDIEGEDESVGKCPATKEGYGKRCCGNSVGERAQHLKEIVKEWKEKGYIPIYISLHNDAMGNGSEWPWSNGFSIWLDTNTYYLSDIPVPEENYNPIKNYNPHIYLAQLFAKHIYKNNLQGTDSKGVLKPIKYYQVKGYTNIPIYKGKMIKQQGLAVMKEIAYANVLMENLFMTNKEDVKKLHDSKFLDYLIKKVYIPSITKFIWHDAYYGNPGEWLNK